MEVMEVTLKPDSQTVTCLWSIIAPGIPGSISTNWESDSARLANDVFGCNRCCSKGGTVVPRAVDDCEVCYIKTYLKEVQMNIICKLCRSW